MRLIDLDDVRHTYCGDCGEYERWNIDPNLLVDAVPVEWIEIDIEASAFSGYDMHSYEVATMLEEWKEKERKEK